MQGVFINSIIIYKKYLTNIFIYDILMFVRLAVDKFKAVQPDKHPGLCAQVGHSGEFIWRAASTRYPETLVLI